MRNRTIAPQFIFCCNAKGSHGGHATGSIFNLSRLKASTKVTEALIRELLFADDCMMSCHTQPDLQHMTTKFSNAAKNYELQISIAKTEVMYQAAPGKPYVEPTITIDNLQLPITKQFKYLGSVLSNDAQMDEDIKARISKASSAYGRLQERVW